MVPPLFPLHFFGWSSFFIYLYSDSFCEATQRLALFTLLFYYKVLKSKIMESYAILTYDIILNIFMMRHVIVLQWFFFFYYYYYCCCCCCCFLAWKGSPREKREINQSINQSIILSWYRCNQLNKILSAIMLSNALWNSPTRTFFWGVECWRWESCSTNVP